MKPYKKSIMVTILCCLMIPVEKRLLSNFSVKAISHPNGIERL